MSDDGMEKRLATAIMAAARETGRRASDDAFEWYASADEMASDILAALTDARTYLVTERSLETTLRRVLMGTSYVPTDAVEDAAAILAIRIATALRDPR